MPKKRRKNRAIRYVTRKARRFRRGKAPMPLLPMVGLAYSLSKPVENAIGGDFQGALAELGARFTGYNYQSKQFDLMYAVTNGYLPIIAGALGSKAMTAIGANRMMRKVPLVGKYIKL